MRADCGGMWPFLLPSPVGDGKRFPIYRQKNIQFDDNTQRGIPQETFFRDPRESIRAADAGFCFPEKSFLLFGGEAPVFRIFRPGEAPVRADFCLRQ